jgi:hypothetical protein
MRESQETLKESNVFGDTLIPFSSFSSKSALHTLENQSKIQQRNIATPRLPHEIHEIKREK